MSEYETILEEYFELKTKYEDAYMRKKGSIINSAGMSKKEKKKQIDKIKMPCIGCRRKVNTVFYDRDRTYGATCGDTSKPCSLNIEIKKPLVDNIEKIMPLFEKALINNENNIKMFKLHLLFGIMDEQEVLSKYSSEKELYLENSDTIQQLEDYLKITQNEDERDKNKKQLRGDIYQSIKEIKESMNDYLINGNIDGLNTTMEIYKETLMDNIKKLRENKYKYTDVERIIIKQDQLPELQVKQKENITADYEIIQEEGKILHFEK